MNHFTYFFQLVNCFAIFRSWAKASATFAFPSSSEQNTIISEYISINMILRSINSVSVKSGGNSCSVWPLFEGIQRI